MVSKTRILHITGYALRGGCEKSCLHFITFDHEHEHEVIVLGPAGPMSNEWRNAGARVFELDILRKSIGSFFARLANSIKGDYGLIVCWSTIRLPLQLHAVTERAKAIKVYLGNPVGRSYRSSKDILLSLFLRKASNVVLMACSQYVAESHARNRYFKRFPIRTSLNPVPVETPVARPRKSRSKFDIGMVARLDPIKDHSTVIRAFAKIASQIPETMLHLVGSGTLHDKLVELAIELRVIDRIIFHGDVEDVRGELLKWDAFVYATTPSEGLGSAVAEAMAAGLPCILSDLPMLRELATGDEQALWFEAGNIDDLASKIQWVYSNPALSERMGVKAHQRALAAFAPSRFISDYFS